MKRIQYLAIPATAAALAFAQPAPAPGGGPPPAGAQPQSMKGVQLKKLAPISNEVLKVKLPRPVESKLKNGLPVLVIENHRLPTVIMDLIIPVTGLSEPAEMVGLSNAVSDLMKEGTKTRTGKQIAERLSELGASLNIGGGGTSTHVYVSTLVENLDPVLELMADVLLNPTFPQEELDKWKNRMMSQLQAMRSSEGFLGHERQMKVLYEGDARERTAPTPESIKAITREAVVEYYKKNYRPAGMLGVAGDVTPAAITAKLEKAIGAWEPGAVAADKFPLKEPIGEKKVYLINRPNSVQTYLLLSNRAIDRMHPDFIATQVMNRVLGAGPAARLFRNIREEKGYTYGVGSGFTAQKVRNHFTASSSVRTEVTGPALDEFLKEFRDIRDRVVPKDELEDAKRAIVAGFALGLENQGSVLGQILTLREYGLPDDYWDTYPAKVMATTAEDVQRVAKKYVPVDNLQLIAVGDATKIRDVLAKYGTVEEYTVEGVKVTR